MKKLLVVLLLTLFIGCGSEKIGIGDDTDEDTNLNDFDITDNGCVSGASKCLDNVVQKCVDGVWIDWDECEDQGLLCILVKGEHICVSDDKKRESTTPDEDKNENTDIDSASDEPGEPTDDENNDGDSEGRVDDDLSQEEPDEDVENDIEIDEDNYYPPIINYVEWDGVLYYQHFNRKAYHEAALSKVEYDEDEKYCDGLVDESGKTEWRLASLDDMKRLFNVDDHNKGFNPSSTNGCVVSNDLNTWRDGLIEMSEKCFCPTNKYHAPECINSYNDFPDPSNECTHPASSNNPVCMSPSPACDTFKYNLGHLSEVLDIGFRFPKDYYSKEEVHTFRTSTIARDSPKLFNKFQKYTINLSYGRISIREASMNHSIYNQQAKYFYCVHDAE